MLRHISRSVAEHLQGLLQVNNVDSIAFAENVFLHLRIPAARLVAEVNSSLQKLLHRNFDSQSYLLSVEGMLILASRRQHPFLPVLPGRELSGPAIAGPCKSGVCRLPSRSRLPSKLQITAC